MSFEKILLILRNTLIQARANKDRRTLEELSTVFTVLEDIATENQNVDLSSLLWDLGYAARGESRKTEWDNIIPTEDKIREVVDSYSD